MSRRMQGYVLICVLFVFCSGFSQRAFAADDQPRVFITDSTSWEVSGNAGGGGGAFASHSSGGARPQTAEIVKTFGEKCTDVVTNNKQDKANYIVVLDHEGGKGLLRHRNKVAVFNAISGDSIVSHSTLSLGGSVQVACDAIIEDWKQHGEAMRAAATSKASTAPVPAAATTSPNPSQGTKVTIASVPEGADIEIDGSFVGNTPSTAELASGDHTISVKLSGYKPWERKMKTAGGDVRINAQLEKN